MPIYEYRCQSCNHDLAVMQKPSNPELSDYPSGGQPPLKKLISPAGFRLKDSGWCETDFKRGDRKKSSVKDDSAPASDSNLAAICDSGCGTCAAPAATTG